MSSAYFQIKAARAQREAFATQLQIRYELYRAGSNEPGTNAPVTLNLLLESQRFWAEALATEYQAIVTYNNAIAGWEYAKGTIMQHDNVTISEGPIPVAAQKRAVEHQRERTKALLLRERESPTGVLSAPLERSGPINIYPQINAGSLPSIYKNAPPLKEAGDLPPVDNLNPEKDGELPNPLQATPLNQIFPESELPTGVKLPEIAPPPAPARPATPSAIKTSAAPGRSKTLRTTSTFGTVRPADDPVAIMPTAVKPATPTPAAKPSFAPAALPEPALSNLPPQPQVPGIGATPAVMPTPTQPILPLDPNSGH